MELVDVNEMWDRLHEQTTRREGWINDFEADLQGVEAERRAMIELELGKLLDSLIEIAHELPPALERMAELQVFEINKLILANREKMDVFNALNIMDNQEFLRNLKFGIGDGHLQYYLYNWRCQEMTADKVGLVLL